MMRKWIIGACLVCSLSTGVLQTVPADENWPAPAERVYTFGKGFRPKTVKLGPVGLTVLAPEKGGLPVESMHKGAPAEGLFKKNDLLIGVDGTAFTGKNAFVVVGTAITRAEAADGKLVFDVVSGKEKKKVTVTIPALGNYGPTWPLDCEKSEKIIAQTASYYAEHLGKQKTLTSAFGYLFLLSTGEDRFLPIIRDYLLSYTDEKTGKAVVGDHTWHNGYNGILAGEYYLRTGDKAVLPVLQAFCDNARDRQQFGIGWGHWGRGINPGYVAGGLMNPASAQILTTLLLGKQCGVEVDDATLLGSLEFFYRFAGHGGVSYGDHRGEGGHGSNGKSGMIAAAMQVATGASGDTTIYRAARDVMAMRMLSSYSNIAVGHGDGGMGDAFWRGVSTELVRERAPDQCRAMMDRLAWWYDLARQPDGSMGLALNRKLDNSAYGVATALSYTAPLKTLCITGAPRSKHAVPFTLPETLWGTKADLAFHLATHHPDYYKHGSDEPIHVPLWRLGTAYTKPTANLEAIPLKEMLRNIHHQRYSIRCQAAKALRQAGRLDVLQGLLSHRDPRLRRAALDGLIDWNYWFAVGKQPLKTDDYNDGMIEAIAVMLSDPEESWYVVEGALFAMRNMPAEVIGRHVDAIKPWTKHEEWWLRDAAFAALSGLEKDPQRYIEILPTLIEMMIGEYRTMPRDRMFRHLQGKVNAGEPGSEVLSLIAAGLKRAVVESEVKPGHRSCEGGYNVVQAAAASLAHNPESALDIARAIPPLFDDMGFLDIVKIVASDSVLQQQHRRKPGLWSALDTLGAEERRQLTDILHGAYRTALIAKLNTGEGLEDRNQVQQLLNTISDLAKLKDPGAGWQVVGAPAPAGRVWRFRSFDPVRDADRRDREDVHRFRKMTLPLGLEGWIKPGYDDKSWKSGHAPVGRGKWKNQTDAYQNRSDWGDGEFLVMRTRIDVKEKYDYYQVRVLAKNGYEVYLQGQQIYGFGWWQNFPNYRAILVTDEVKKHLKQGVNVLAVRAGKEYPGIANPNGWPDTPEIGVIDCYLEGMKASDLEIEEDATRTK